MGKHKSCWSLCITDLYMCIVVAAIFFPSCEARKSIYAFIGTTSVNSRNSDISAATTIKQIKTLNRIDIDMPLDSSNTQPSGVSSPISLPPYDSLPPTPLPQNAPPFCLYPPFTPQPPSATGGGGGGYSPLVPPPPTPMSSAPIVNPPPPSQAGSVPPSGTVPSPSISTSPPGSSVASPPTSNVPSPWGLIPSPPVFLPPIVYPKPAVPPPPNVTPSTALWCVANPSVPEPIIQEAMNYACGSGADCAQIQPNGACFQPDTLLAHASYAFNSYWQRTKAAGGTCEFGGTAMLVTVDPSYDDCHFMYN